MSWRPFVDRSVSLGARPSSLCGFLKIEPDCGTDDGDHPAGQQKTSCQAGRRSWEASPNLERVVKLSGSGAQETLLGMGSVRNDERELRG